ncbi:hypothetical protein [Vibrio barjaei]|uniref:hypothetical protein n=1 Tax=Vibrio barjaei TaxID=1676683 RepID=UPI0022851CBD|nr:hypothetical protein [Vibrio barjaei]MCY9874073.1 hypothetical protein [Vibrio barjaei]
MKAIIIDTFNHQSKITFGTTINTMDAILSTPTGLIKKNFRTHNLAPGDEVTTVGTSAPERLTKRLKKLGIEIEFGCNAPWIYIDSINNIRITETFAGNHGFTAFFLGKTTHNDCKFSNIRKVFELIRKQISTEHEYS